MLTDSAEPSRTASNGSTDLADGNPTACDLPDGVNDQALESSLEMVLPDKAVETGIPAESALSCLEESKQATVAAVDTEVHHKPEDAAAAAEHEEVPAGPRLDNVGTSAVTASTQSEEQPTAARDMLWAYESDANDSHVDHQEDDDEILAMLAAVHPKHSIGAASKSPADLVSASTGSGVAKTGNAAPVVMEPKQATAEIMALRRHMMVAIARIRALEAEKAAAARRLAAASACSHHDNPQVRHCRSCRNPLTGTKGAMRRSWQGTPFS